MQFPAVIEKYLSTLTARIKNRRVRADVLRELRGHFLDVLIDVEEKDRARLAEELVREFGSPDLLAELIKRAKKRCRPAWQKFLIRSLQGLLGMITLFVVYSLWALFDKPSPTIDYVAEFNAQARPAAATDSQNAAPLYLLANERFIQPPGSLDKNVIGTPGISLSPAETPAMRHWISQNEPALVYLRKAAQKPHAWFMYKSKDGEVNNILLPHLGTMRSFARFLYWRIWRVDGEDQEEILADLRPAYAMARHLLEKGPTIIEQLVGNAINTLSAVQTRQLLRAGKIKPESLPLLTKILDDTYPQGYPTMSFEGEVACGLDIIQRTFTNGGVGGGHLCPRALIGYLEMYQSKEEGQWASLIKKPQLIFFIAHPRREETTSQLKEYYALQEQANVPPYERSLKPKNPFKEFLKKNVNNLILSDFLPALDRAAEQNFRGKAEFEATRTVAALLQYRHDRGRYPEALAELVPAYLKHLPRDPYGPDTFIYRRTGNDFILYSRGVNLRDDGGKHDERWAGPTGWEKGSLKGFVDADYIFWPPVRPERKE